MIHRCPYGSTTTPVRPYGPSAGGRSTVAPVSAARATQVSTSDTLRCRDTLTRPSSGAVRPNSGCSSARYRRAPTTSTSAWPMRSSSMTTGSPTTRAPSASVYQAMAARASRTTREGTSSAVTAASSRAGDPDGLPQRPVHRRHHGAQGRGDDVRVDAHAPQDTVADRALHVGGRPCVPAGGHRVLGVVEDADVDADGLQRVDERCDRAVAPSLDGHGDAGVGQLHHHLVELLTVRPVPVADKAQSAPGRVRVGQVLVAKRGPHLLGGDFAALVVGVPLDDRAELDLQPARQVEVVLGLHDVGDAALAGLAVHPDHGLVAAPDVLGVDRQVRDGPDHLVDGLAGRFRVGLQRREALVDGVLVGTGEGGVDQVAAVRVPLVHAELVAVLDGAADLVDVGEVDLRVDALAEQVQAEGHQVDVAGALAVAEQAALDAVGAGTVTELGGGDGGAAVVVRVQGEDDGVPAAQVAVHPLDLVGVDRGLGHLHRRRQVDDRRPLDGGLPDVGDRVAHLDGEVELGAGEGLGGVLEPDVGVAHVLGQLVDQLGAVDGDVDDAGPVGVEDDPPLQGAGRVVEVDDRVVGAPQRLEGALDQLVTGLGEDLDRDVVRDQVLLDQLTDEVEIGLTGRREADLDLLVAHADQQLEHPPLAVGRHRVDQRLVAVAQVDRAPAGGDGGDLLRPGAVGKSHRGEGRVAVDRHPRGLLRMAYVRVLAHRFWLLWRGLDSAPWGRSAGAGNAQTPRRGGRPRRGPRRGG